MSLDRLDRLRDGLMALLATAQKIADAVRDQGQVPVPLLADETDPEAGPFVLKGFAEHFIRRSRSGLGHVIYAYRRPDGDGTIDPNAQFHLQQMLGELLSFNLYCQRAEMDEALAVALQAPDVALRIDSMLAKLAFFAAFFDNMIALLPKERHSTAEDLEQRLANIERHLLMARDKMFSPQDFEQHLPSIEWPFVGVEVAFAPHDDDYFINCVYFPAEYAKLLLEAQQNMNGHLDAVA
ncbi:MAG: hypothetical protein R3D44_13250 [Hyphomicrobiaceae bacterium]